MYPYRGFLFLEASKTEDSFYKEVKRSMSDKDETKKSSASASSLEQRKEADRLLFLNAKGGDLLAREKLILKYLYLVRHLMTPFVNKGVPRDVLFQEGCYGLILAVDRFDPDRGTAFNTYAGHYVKKYLHKALSENSPRPIPFKEKYSKRTKEFRDAEEYLKEKNNRAPSVQEIAEHIGISYNSAAALLSNMQQAVYLDAPNAEEQIQSKREYRSTEDSVLSSLNEMCLDDFSVSLTKREVTILFLRFGFGEGNEPHTFGEIAKILNVSYDTVCDTYREAIAKLRESRL